VNDLYDELYKFWQYSQKDINRLVGKIYEWRKRYDDEKNFISFSTATSAILPIWRKPLLFLFAIVLRSQTQV